MALTDRQKQRARYHLEYTQLTTLTGLSLGSPVITQAKFIIDSNLILLDHAAEPDVIATLERLDCNERQRDELADTISTGVVASGSTKFDFETSLRLLERRYLEYKLRLADQLAGFINPVSATGAARRGGVTEGDAF